MSMDAVYQLAARDRTTILAREQSASTPSKVSTWSSERRVPVSRKVTESLASWSTRVRNTISAALPGFGCAISRGLRERVAAARCAAGYVPRR
jgi:hypothetical protein